MGKGVQIGLRELHYAILIEDPVSGVASYQAPVRLSGAMSANVNPNASNETLFADDGPYDTASTLGQIALELGVADIPLDNQAELLGHTIVGGVMIRKSSDTPPFVAVGFKSLKSNGKYRYTWLAKGKFAAGEQSNETKGDSVSFQTPTISGSFLKRDCDDEWERHIDEDHIDYVASMGTNWFNSPYGGDADITAPTVQTVVPANAAPGVAVGSVVTWTFTEALALSTATKSNFLVVKDSDGSNVAGSLSINVARTQVTFTPTDDLSAATEYTAIVTEGVKDAAGNAIAAPYVTKFTTA
jgi:phi13 family phage major tail protein